MRYFRGILVVLALLCTVSIASADSIPDPRIVIGGDEASIGVDINFTFKSEDITGGGYYGDIGGPSGNGGTGDPIFGTGLYNASGVNWTNLLISVPVPWGSISDVWVPLWPSTSPAGTYVLSTDRFFGSQIWEDQVAGKIFILFSGVGFIQGDFTDIIIFPGITSQGANSHFFINLNNDGNSGGGGWLDQNHKGLIFEATANYNPIPEPGSLALLLGGLGMIGMRLYSGRSSNNRHE
jgi:hypothetical protein